MTRFGINVSPNTPFARQVAFGDALMRARTVDPAHTVLYGAMDGGVPPGEYLIGGEVQNPILHGARQLPKEDGVYSARFQVPAGLNGLVLTWEGDRVPSFVCRTGDGLGFMPAFLRLLERQAGGRGPAVVRTLDWSGVNRAWTPENPNPLDPRNREIGNSGRLPQGSPAGVRYIHHARLARSMGCPLHLNIPHPEGDADGAYLDAIGALVRQVRRWLPVGLPMYVEVGNEAWNQGFPLHHWLKRHGEPAAAYGRLCRTIFERLHAEHGAKIRPFVGGFIQSPGWLQTVLEQIPEGLVYAAGPAAYFGPSRRDRDAWNAAGVVPSQEELRDACLTRIGQLEDLLRASRSVIGEAEFYCYEAGQSLIAGYAPWRAAALRAQREPWMGEAYAALTRTMDRAGVELTAWYSLMTDPAPPAPTDVFGMLERMDQDPASSPKGWAFLEAGT